MVTKSINEIIFHQNFIWYHSDFLSASNSLRVSQINFGNLCSPLSSSSSFSTLCFFFIHHCHLLRASLVHHCCVLHSQALSMAETTAANASAANASTIEASSFSQDSYNLSNPLFLHPGENLGAVFTSQPFVEGENYPAWARSVRKSLIAKNKLGFIDGSLTISSSLVNSPIAA